ncbi:MAG: DUF4249 family protein [Bacteroidota bacterium]
MKSPGIHTETTPLALLPRIVLACMIVLFLSSCEEKTSWDLETQERLMLVVEGSITNQKKAHEVKLSTPAWEINGEVSPVSGAIVSISDGEEVFLLSEQPAGSGLYYTEPDVQGVYGRDYTLQIVVEDYTFTAVSRMDAVTPFQTIYPYKVSSDPDLYQLYIAESSTPAIVKLSLDWSSVPGYETLDARDNHAIIYHYSLSSIDVNEMFAAKTGQVRFPPGTQIEAEKISVSPDYEEFLRGMLSETTWNGGVFDVKAGNPKSNLSAGATGYFNASTVITVSEVFYP